MAEKRPLTYEFSTFSKISPCVYYLFFSFQLILEFKEKIKQLNTLKKKKKQYYHDQVRVLTVF